MIVKNRIKKCVLWFIEKPRKKYFNRYLDVLTRGVQKRVFLMKINEEITICWPN